METAAPLWVVDRKTGALVEERVFGGAALRRIYGGGLASTVLRRLMPQPWVSALYGRLQRRPSSRLKVPGFVADLGIDANEAERPWRDYETLDAFFTRRLRPGARPIDPAADALLSPADGRALAFAGVVGDLPIKGQRVPLAVLVGAPLPFERAAVLVVRLAPADYHRFHAPADGVLGGPRVVGGPLQSVHPIALAAGAPSFANRRHVSLLHSEVAGALYLVEVGALLVGEIERTRAPGPVRRGDELGLFHFGGSTVVLVADAARVALDDDLLRSTARGLETLVRQGERVARCAAGPAGHAGPPSGAVSRA